MNDFFQIGVITSTHGIKGEVKVFPTTSSIDRFKSLKKVILDTGRERIDLEIEGVKFFKKFAILKFRGINSINDIEKYKGKSLLVPREDAIKLGKDEYFIADLINITVIDEEENMIGHLKDVLETGANDVYVIETQEKKEILLPAIKDCIIDVDIEKKKMKIHIMEGLLD